MGPWHIDLKSSDTQYKKRSHLNAHRIRIGRQSMQLEKKFETVARTTKGFFQVEVIVTGAVRGDPQSHTGIQRGLGPLRALGRTAEVERHAAACVMQRAQHSCAEYME